jgi:hypothetical protein
MPTPFMLYKMEVLCGTGVDKVVRKSWTKWLGIVVDDFKIVLRDGLLQEVSREPTILECGL